MPATVHTLYTIGHSTRAVGEFIDLLGAQRMELLVDVRTAPGSRRNPQFNRDALARSLEEAGIDYRHDKNLGGLRKPRPDSVNGGWKHPAFRAYADHMQGTEFQTALKILLDQAAATATAVMCAEVLPWRCHRWLIADAACARGWRVCHIMGANKLQQHTMTTFARVENEHLTYPCTRTGE